MQNQPEQPSENYLYGFPPPAPSRAADAGAPRGRSWAAVAAMISAGLACLFLLGMLGFGTAIGWNGTLIGEDTDAAGARAFLLFLLAGLLVLAATVGLVLSVVAIADGRVRSGARPGRVLAIASLVLGPLTFMGCIIVVVVLIATDTSP
jgi:hypothetical protein